METNNNNNNNNNQNGQPVNFNAFNNILDWYEFQRAAELFDNIADLLRDYSETNHVPASDEIQLARLMRNACNRAAIDNGETPFAPTKEL